MKGFHIQLEKSTEQNISFRKVLYTGKYCQLVLMSLLPQEEIGLETHEDNDQFFRFEKGTGTCVIENTEYSVTDGDAIIVPAGTKHNIINTSSETRLLFYTIYSPAHHKDGIERVSKKEAIENEAPFDGKTSE